MGLSAAQRDRLAELSREAGEILGGCLHSNGQPMTFAELEDQCIEAGDLFTATVLQQRVAERRLPEQSPCCPDCGRPGERNAECEPRVLQTDRGEVCWLEPSYFCRPCRRSFFPSVR
jgi:hypothetical protein